MIIVRYADDFVMGFQDRGDAERFLRELRRRFEQFGLQLHPEKTRLIEFGRYAAERREKRGQGKPETFNFLGFTHYCGTTRKGTFTIKRKSIAKRMRAKLQEIKQQLQATHARCGGRGRPMAAFRGPRVVQLPRGPRQHPLSERIPYPGATSLAARPPEAQPERALLGPGSG